MSSPATSCSRRYTDSASTYCSRKRLSTIASRNDLIPRFSVYQLGRGSDPVIVVGNPLPAVAFSIDEHSTLSLSQAETNDDVTRKCTVSMNRTRLRRSPEDLSV